MFMKNLKNAVNVVEELRECLTPEEFTKKGSSRPCGTRFVAHKLAALDRLMELTSAT